MRTTYLGTLLGTLGIAAGLLAAAVAVAATGVGGDRVTSFWMPGALGAASLSPAYAAPRTPLWALALGGAALGLAYAGMVLCAAAITDRPELLAPSELLAWAAGIGAVPPLAAGLLYRWLDRRWRRSVPPIG